MAGYGRSTDEEVESFEVASAYAFGGPGAVVIELPDADVTLFAVTYIFHHSDLAFKTISR